MRKTDGIAFSGSDSTRRAPGMASESAEGSGAAADAAAIAGAGLERAWMSGCSGRRTAFSCGNSRKKNLPVGICGVWVRGGERSSRARDVGDVDEEETGAGAGDGRRGARWGWGMCGQRPCRA